MSSSGERAGGDTVTNDDDCVMLKYFPTHKAINAVNSFQNKPEYDARIRG
jgi:hypothetical protein